MNEENKAFELTDEDLDKVSGGDLPPSSSETPVASRNCPLKTWYKNHDCTTPTIYSKCDGCPGRPLT